VLEPQEELLTGGRPPRADKLSDQVARGILSDIVSRDLRPGTMLPSEAQLLRDFEVGRASIREALRILEVHGLIQIKQGSRGGPMVAAVQSRDFGRMATFYFQATRARFEHLLEARLVLEPVMARMAAEKLTETSRTRICDNLEAAQRAMNDTGPRWSRLSSEFHGLISGGTGNPVLDLYGSSLNDIHSERTRPIFPARRRDEVLRVHQKIADAICAGDGDQAEHLARRHIEELIKGMKKLDPGLMSEIIHWH
jgi:DNA-binding FadR family transcriptional regulator